MTAVDGEKNDVVKMNTWLIEFLLKWWMQRNDLKNKKTASYIHWFTKYKKLKILFSCKQLQTKNHTQNKIFEISQSDWYECHELKKIVMFD